MTTARKLWLGLGVLAVVLAATSLIMIRALSSLEARLGEITSVKQPTSAATYEMEINVIGTGMGVLKYLETAEPEFRQRVTKDQADFERFKAQYDRLADTPKAKALGAEVGALYGEYRALGQSLMDGKDRRQALLTRIARASETIDQILARLVDRAGTGGREKAEDAAQMRASMAQVGNWLGHYRRTFNPDYKTRIFDSGTDFRQRHERFRKLGLTGEEQSWAAELGRLFDQVMAQVTEMVLLEEGQREEMAKFLDLQARLDRILDGEIQTLTLQGLEAAKAAAHRAATGVLATVLIMLVVGLLIGVGTALMVGRGILSAESALQAERERLRVTLASIGDAILVTDSAGRVVSLNPVAQALTGWTQEEAAGQSLEAVFRIVNEATREPAENPVGRVIQKGAVAGLANHTLLIARDGTEIPIDDSAAPTRDARGTVVGVVLIFRDISERRRAERALQDALVYNENIVETVREPLLVLDKNLRVQSANRAFYHAFQVTPPETENRVLWDLGGGQWDIPRLRHLLEEILPGNTELRDFEVEHDVPATGRRTMLLNARRAYREGNHTELILLAMEDITERKRLEGIAAQRAQELVETDRNKDEFLAMLSHELRNPLAAIRNSLLVLGLRPDAATEDRARDVMEREAGKMTRLVDDLLDASRISRGRIELRKEPVNLETIVGHAAEAARHHIDSRSHQLSISLPSEPVWVDADPVRMEQAVGNLLSNAAKYTKPGGRIAVTVERDGIEAVVRVCDSGIGIASEMLPRVFDLFMHADTSLARSPGGLGIGLALVRRLVEMHGGSVAAHSAGAGHGSEFVIRLPVLGAPSRGQPATQERVEHPPPESFRAGS